jgi:hypothetical protein
MKVVDNWHLPTTIIVNDLSAQMLIKEYSESSLHLVLEDPMKLDSGSSKMANGV